MAGKVGGEVELDAHVVYSIAPGPHAVGVLDPEGHARVGGAVAVDALLAACGHLRGFGVVAQPTAREARAHLAHERSDFVDLEIVEDAGCDRDEPSAGVDVVHPSMVGRRIGEGDLAFVRIDPAVTRLKHFGEVEIVDEGIGIDDFVHDAVEPAADVHDRRTGVACEIGVDLADRQQMTQAVDGGWKSAELLRGAPLGFPDAHRVLRPGVREDVRPAARGLGAAHQREEERLLYVVQVHGESFRWGG